MLTPGLSGGLELILCSYLDPLPENERVIFTDEATYFCALAIFKDHKAIVVSVPGTANGMDVDALEKILADMPSTPYIRVIYSVTAYNNPTGATLSPENSIKLIKLANIHNLLILSDECYQFLSYKTAPPLPLALYPETANRVLSLGSMTKIFAPGLRIGWILAASDEKNLNQGDTLPGAPSIYQKLTARGFLFSGGNFNSFTATLLSTLFKGGYIHKQITHYQNLYSKRAELLVNQLKDTKGISIALEPRGGYFIWVTFDPKVGSAAALKERAQKMGVDFRIGNTCTAKEPPGFPLHGRLCFAFYEENLLKEAIHRLEQTISTF